MQRSRFTSIGFSLIEMLVSISILSILASVAIPFAQHGATRAQEIELKRSLREIRKAIDEFHSDCKNNRFTNNSIGVSANCYPESLEVLVQGVTPLALDDSPYKYLRRIPKDPFLPNDIDIAEHWAFRSYTDSVDSTIWGGDDIFDVYVSHERVSLRGVPYSQW